MWHHLIAKFRKLVQKMKRKLRNAKFNRARKIFLFMEDWILLALLGIIMSVCSLGMDQAIDYLQNWHFKLIGLISKTTFDGLNIFLTYLVWVAYPVVFVTLSAILVHYLAPQAIGSGIPEMKVILRGVMLKEYLTFKTLIWKMAGLTLSLGSGMPIGKEGPFVHVASVLANLLSRLSHTYKGAYANESQKSELLAIGCVVGVACTFSAPVGGVLFSIEVTSVYFAVRNYWRGFFAAACSAITFRLLRVWLQLEITVTAFQKTDFPRYTFLPEELPIFALIGIVCGFLSALFIYVQRTFVLFIRQNKWVKIIYQKYWVIYPILISLLISSITYPKGFGMFIGHEYFLTILASTLPIPSGIFGPSFVLGAAIGRITGEIVAILEPEGFHGPNDLQVFPGVYAVVGAAAFCGGVTHTVSVTVIVFEITGQLMYIVPVMIAVLLSNAISSYFQPSIYDSIMKVKKLPYLPNIPPSKSCFHHITTQQIMTKDVRYLTKNSTYEELQKLLLDMPKIKSFPIVDSHESLLLMGSCSRSKLLRLLESKVGTEARRNEARKRVKLPHTVSEEPLISLLIDHSNTMRSEMEETPRIFINDSPLEEETASEQETMRINRFLIKPVISESISDDHGIRKISSESGFSIFDEPSTSNTTHSSRANLLNTLHSFQKIPKHLSNSFRNLAKLHHRKKGKCDYDLTDDERKAWEQAQLAQKIDFSPLEIDSAPFQLVESTSLMKIHSLFSLLGLNRCYVTRCGKLVGVVVLKDLRIAIEKAQNGYNFDNSSASDVDQNSSKTIDSLCPLSEPISRTSSNLSSVLEASMRERALMGQIQKISSKDIIPRVNSDGFLQTIHEISNRPVRKCSSETTKRFIIDI